MVVKVTPHSCRLTFPLGLNIGSYDTLDHKIEKKKRIWFVVVYDVVYV